MEQGRSTETAQEVRLWIMGDVTKVTELLPTVLAEQGLQVDQIQQQPARRGLMDFADVVLTVVISTGTAIAANYAQDKRISEKIDAALKRLKEKATELIQWSSEHS
jgi:alpha-beta hydrolase superfamily lysophospholipase